MGPPTNPEHHRGEGLADPWFAWNSIRIRVADEISVERQTTRPMFTPVTPRVLKVVMTCHQQQTDQTSTCFSSSSFRGASGFLGGPRHGKEQKIARIRKMTLIKFVLDLFGLGANPRGKIMK